MTNKGKEQLDYVYEQINKLKLELADCILAKDLVVGGLSGMKTSRERALKLTLSLTVDDLTNPVYEINFLNSNLAIPKDSEIYHKIYSDINKWHKTISVILKRNEKLNT